MESALSHPLRDEDIDFKLLEAQLHIAQAAQVLREQDRGHGLSIGVTRGASLASASDHEGSDVDTPALSHDAFTPSTDSDAPTPAAWDGIKTAHPRRPLDGYFANSKELSSLLRLSLGQPKSRTSIGSSSASNSRAKESHSKDRSTISVSDDGTPVAEDAESALKPTKQGAIRDVPRTFPLTRHGIRTLRRSRSLSSLPELSPKQHHRRLSLPDLDHHGQDESLFNLQSPARELKVPGLRPHVLQQNRDPEISEEVSEVIAVAKPKHSQVDEEKAQRNTTDQTQETHVSIWKRARNSVIATYAPRVPPALILPSAPTDHEKTMYLKTNRAGLYSFGVFSFLSLSAGMWLFVVSAVQFYWFGAVVCLLQAYLCVSYVVSIFGKDFDFKAHEENIERYPINPETAPTVDIYLPCCKEPLEVLENTYKHVQKLEWPAHKLKVWVLDDGGDLAVQVKAAEYGFHYICREDRPRLKKAGNLRWAFARTEGEYFVIYDADFCPRSDFLKEIIPEHLANPEAAIIQTPQFFRTKPEQTWVEQGAGSVQELFYRIIQVNRNRWGASICVGSNAVYRRAALVEVGGTAEIGFSEDVHTGFYALTRGWQVRYVPLCLACGICPDTPRAFFSQQMRWCMGSTTLLTNPDFWKSGLSVTQKICYLSGMMYYSAISLGVFLNPLPGILMIWVRPEYVRYYNLAFAVPSLLFSFIAIRFWAKASYGFNVQFIMVIQAYAYLTAIKDRIFGRALAWVPSGDTKAHKNNKYRNMRILAWTWTLSVMGALVSGVVYQLLRALPWYDVIPILCLDTFNIFLAHRFLFCHGKL